MPESFAKGDASLSRGDKSMIEIFIVCMITFLRERISFSKNPRLPLPLDEIYSIFFFARLGNV